MKKIMSLALCLLMILLPLSGAIGEARLPMERGAVTDDADVLSAQTASDIGEYAERVESETGIDFYVAIVHFLDGIDAQTYADRLFKSWHLDDDAMLLLGAAGEDTFATAMGTYAKKKIGEKNAENLMFTSSSFSELFKTQQYDMAFGKYFIALNTLLSKQFDSSIKLKNLFKAAQTESTTTQTPTQSTVNFGSQLWSEVMEAIEDNTADYQVYHEQRERRSGNGVSASGWIVLAIIAYIVLRQRPTQRAGKYRKNNDRRSGCGCGPIGWIVSLLGLNVLIDSLLGRRRS
ncbi:MAG: TPM domain-containing protein [Clostridiales bacterium]|nr:TPM domain-containing protein [Clostridiales bacterium]